MTNHGGRSEAEQRFLTPPDGVETTGAKPGTTIVAPGGNPGLGRGRTKALFQGSLQPPAQPEAIGEPTVITPNPFTTNTVSVDSVEPLTPDAIGRAPTILTPPPNQLAPPRLQSIPPTTDPTTTDTENASVSVPILRPVVSRNPAENPDAIRRRTDEPVSSDKRGEGPSDRRNPPAPTPQELEKDKAGKIGGGGSDGGSSKPSGDPEVRREINLVGQVLETRFKINSLLGEGGMGKVYAGENIKIGKQIAVKVLHPEFAHGEHAVRLHREARAATKINHPHIIEIYDFGETPDESPFMVMELLKGKSLDQQLFAEGHLPIKKVATIFEQLSSAIGAAHAAGIIHRDLKPENIFLIDKPDHSIFIKVVDFGIAKDSSSTGDANLTKIGTVCGTPNYMSPEQCVGNPATPQSDIYTIGVILYELLSNQLLFTGENTGEILRKHISQKPQNICELCPNMPESIGKVIMKALKKEIPDRYQTIEEMWHDFNEAVQAYLSETTQAVGNQPFKVIVPQHEDPPIPDSSAENLIVAELPGNDAKSASVQFDVEENTDDISPPSFWRGLMERRWVQITAVVTSLAAAGAMAAVIASGSGEKPNNTTTKQDNIPVSPLPKNPTSIQPLPPQPLPQRAKLALAEPVDGGLPSSSELEPTATEVKETVKEVVAKAQAQPAPTTPMPDTRIKKRIYRRPKPVASGLDENLPGWGDDEEKARDKQLPEDF